MIFRAPTAGAPGRGRRPRLRRPARQRLRRPAARSWRAHAIWPQRVRSQPCVRQRARWRGQCAARSPSSAAATSARTSCAALAWAAATSCVGGGALASASSTDARGSPACTAATVTTHNSNATRGRRSGARRRSELRRFASPLPLPPEPRYPPRPPPPLPSFIFLSNSRGTSRKRCARALIFLARYLPGCS